MTELKILYISKNEEANITYLYDSVSKILLPMETTKSSEGDNLGQLLKSLLCLLKVQKVSFEIYKHQDDTFYWYLNIRTNKKLFKINCDSELVTYFADKCNIPLYAKQKIIQTQGIKINEDLLDYGLIT